MKYFKILFHILWVGSELYIIYRIYFEAGFWTCFFAFMVTCTIEVFDLAYQVQRQFNQLFQEHVRAHLREEVNINNISKTIANMVKIRANV